MPRTPFDRSAPWVAPPCARAPKDWTNYYITEQIAGNDFVAAFRQTPNPRMLKARLHIANHALEQAHRWLDFRLIFIGRPVRKPDATDVAEADRLLHDLLVFVAQGAVQPLTMLDRFPATRAGHIAYVEWVRDEVTHAAKAKRQQLLREYSNATLASMVGGIKWAEAADRTAMLVDLPADVAQNVAKVLRREFLIVDIEHRHRHNAVQCGLGSGVSVQQLQAVWCVTGQQSIGITPF